MKIKNNGIYYNSKTDYFAYYILGKIMGKPNTLLHYFIDLLDKIDRQERKSEDATNKEYLFNLCVLYKSEFIDYSMSIDRCWLTVHGKDLLTELKWCLEHEKEEFES